MQLIQPLYALIAHLHMILLFLSSFVVLSPSVMSACHKTAQSIYCLLLSISFLWLGLSPTIYIFSALSVFKLKSF